MILLHCRTPETRMLMLLCRDQPLAHIYHLGKDIHAVVVYFVSDIIILITCGLFPRNWVSAQSPTQSQNTKQRLACKIATVYSTGLSPFSSRSLPSSQNVPAENDIFSPYLRRYCRCVVYSCYCWSVDRCSRRTGFVVGWVASLTPMWCEIMGADRYSYFIACVQYSRCPLV